MSKSEIEHVAQQTQKIIASGHYELDGTTVKLPKPLPSPFSVMLEQDDIPSYTDILVVTPDESESFRSQVELSLQFPEFSPAEIILSPRDPFAAARQLEGASVPPLVLCFASPDIINNKRWFDQDSQTGVFCLNSTLSASYETLFADEPPENPDTDRFKPQDILVSSDVCVFRDSENRLIKAPFQAAVMTVADPNCKAAFASSSAMREQLRRALATAAVLGYDRLILGVEHSWGAPTDVAMCFRRILIDEGYAGCFSRIDFALPDGADFEAFSAVFARSASKAVPDNVFPLPKKKRSAAFLEAPRSGGLGSSAAYAEALQAFPVCNYTERLLENNIGWTQGILLDGTPFAAEIFRSSGNVYLQVLMPVRELLPALSVCEDEAFKVPDEDPAWCEDGASNFVLPSGDVMEYCGTDSYYDFGALAVGMTPLKESVDIETCMQYVERLENEGLVQFTGRNRNGNAVFSRDAAGSKIVRITVALQDNDGLNATTPLHFRSFGSGGHSGNVIPFAARD